MAQILPRVGFGARAGAAFSTGLGEGLKALAEQKMSQLAQRQQPQQGPTSQEGTIAGLISLGIPEEKAVGLSFLSPQIQQNVVKDYLQRAQGQGVGEALGAISVPEDIPEEVSDLDLPEIHSLLKEYQALPEKEQFQILDREGIPRIPKAPEEITIEETRERKRREREPKISSRQRAIQKALKKPGITEEQRFKLAAVEQKERFERKKIGLAEQKEANAVTKEYFADVSKKGRGTAENNIRLDKMQKLLDMGRFTPKIFAAAIKGLSPIIDISGFMSPETIDFDKLSMDFLKNIKDIFGARITNMEVRNFLKTVPTIIMSDAGKQRVINNLKMFNAGALARKKVMNTIIKANGGKRPVDLEIRTDEIVDPLLDKIMKKFRASERVHPSELSPNLGSKARKILRRGAYFK